MKKLFINKIINSNVKPKIKKKIEKVPIKTLPKTQLEMIY